MKFQAPILLLLFIVFTACKSPQGSSMTVNINVNGLQKGILILQKINNNELVDLDSIYVHGNKPCTFNYEISEPEVFYISLSEKEIEKITFFGEKGTIDINTKLDRFGTSAQISGSKTNDILEEYNRFNSEYNNERLELIKENYEAVKNNDDELLEITDQKLLKLFKNKYRFTANFIIRNKHSEVAPYLALTELFDANTHLLEKVNNELPNDIQKSKYGVILGEYINEITDSN